MPHRNTHGFSSKIMDPEKNRRGIATRKAHLSNSSGEVAVLDWGQITFPATITIRHYSRHIHSLANVSKTSRKNVPTEEYSLVSIEEPNAYYEETRRFDPAEEAIKEVLVRSYP